MASWGPTVRNRPAVGRSSMPLELEAGVRPVGDEAPQAIEYYVDHRELGMTHSTLGMLPTP